MAKDFDDHFAKKDTQMACEACEKIFNIISIREAQVKTAMRYDYIKRVKLKRLTIPNVDENMEKPGLSYTAGGHKIIF